MIIKYIVEDIGRKIFIKCNYYQWEMINDKGIWVQINEYHKQPEDLKEENVNLPDNFITKLLIEKLQKSWTDYKQQGDRCCKGKSFSVKGQHGATQTEAKPKEVRSKTS